MHLPSAPIEKAGAQPETQILVELNAQIGLALGLVEIVKDAHLGLVVGAAPDLGAYEFGVDLPVYGPRERLLIDGFE